MDAPARRGGEQGRRRRRYSCPTAQRPRSRPRHQPAPAPRRRHRQRGWHRYARYPPPAAPRARASGSLSSASRSSRPPRCRRRTARRAATARRRLHEGRLHYRRQRRGPRGDSCATPPAAASPPAGAASERYRSCTKRGRRKGQLRRPFPPHHRRRQDNTGLLSKRGLHPSIVKAVPPQVVGSSARVDRHQHVARTRVRSASVRASPLYSKAGRWANQARGEAGRCRGTPCRAAATRTPSRSPPLARLQRAACRLTRRARAQAGGGASSSPGARRPHPALPARASTPPAPRPAANTAR